MTYAAFTPNQVKFQVINLLAGNGLRKTIAQRLPAGWRHQFLEASPQS